MAVIAAAVRFFRRSGFAAHAIPLRFGLLASAGVSELARVKLASHTEWKQTDRYTDPTSLPLFSEIEKFDTA